MPQNSCENLHKSAQLRENNQETEQTELLPIFDKITKNLTHIYKEIKRKIIINK